jgi:hypothetical protein
MSAPSTTTTGGNVFKNIIVGVVTTVLGAAAVYFLGFHESKNEDFEKRKEATETAWNSYHKNMDIFSRVLKKMDDGSSDIEKRRTDINHEMDATILSLNNIKKDENIDARINTIIDLKIPEMNDFKTIVNDYFTKMQEFAATNPTQEEGMKFIGTLGGKFIADVKSLRNRDSTRFAEYYTELQKEYKLKMPE